MLVLSRRLGESLVVNDQLVLTIALLAEDYVELSLINATGSFLVSFTARADESVSLTDAIQVTVIQFEGEKVRLGVEGPRDSRIDRGEFWNLPR
jgi:carbon storage regulator CsrA